MLIHCQHCHTPFTLVHENVITALDQLEDNGWKHYNAYCPRCGRANVVGREQLMKAAPEWTPGGIVSPRPEPVTAPPEVARPTPTPKPVAAAKPAAKPAKKAAVKTTAAKKPAAKKPAPKKAVKKKAAAKPKSKAKPAAKKKSKKK